MYFYGLNGKTIHHAYFLNKMLLRLSAFILIITALCTNLQGQDGFDITKELADPQKYIFTDGKTTVQGYIYSRLEQATACCGNDDIYIEVTIDPTGFVVDAKALTGKSECYKLSIVDIVRNIKWVNNDIKSQRKIFFPVKPLKACTGADGENVYSPIPVTNNPINNKPQAATASTPAKVETLADNNATNEYAQRERERLEREEAQNKAREEAERLAAEDAKRKSDDVVAMDAEPEPESKSDETPAPVAINAEEEAVDEEYLNRYTLESEEERLAREAAEAKALKEEEARLKAELEADVKSKAQSQAALKAKKEAEARNKKSSNEQELRSRIEAELREKLRAELEAELNSASKGNANNEEEAAEEEDSEAPEKPSLKTPKPQPNAFTKYPGYVSTGEKTPDASHRGSHVNAKVPQFNTPQFIEQSGAALFIKNKLKENGICGLAQSVAEVAVDRSGNVTSHRIFKSNTEQVSTLMPSILNGMKFKPETISYNGQLVYIEFKADIFCPSTPTKGIDLDQVENYLQVNR